MAKSNQIRVDRDFKKGLDCLKNTIKSKTGRNMSNSQLTRSITPLLNMHVDNIEAEKKRNQLKKYKLEVYLR